MTIAPLSFADDDLRRILLHVKTIAMVGASTSEMRPSYFAMLYLQGKGYRVLPVNPRSAGETLLGETVYPDLASLPLRPGHGLHLPPLVRGGSGRRRGGAAWHPGGVDAARRARRRGGRARPWPQGAEVIMDRCPKIEYGRLFGEIGWLGVNRGIVSAKRGQATQLKTQEGRPVLKAAATTQRQRIA